LLLDVIRGLGETFGVETAAFHVIRRKRANVFFDGRYL
jgi:hypothetical protein